MFPVSVEEFCEITNGLIVGDISPDTMISSVVIDSRQAKAGSAFVALPGRHCHGIEFAQSVRSIGGVVIADGSMAEECPVPCVAVPDAENSLALIAHHNRRRSDALVIALSGSVGKTTTRRMIASVLRQSHNGIESIRNYNNLQGLPLTLLDLTEDSEFAVVEMGASAIGEIAVLSSIAQPDFAVVTSVSPAHLDGFGSLDAIQKTKAELVQSVQADGVVFLNADDQRVRSMADLTQARVVLFGESEDADVRVSQIDVQNECLAVHVNESTFQVPVCGRHHTNAVLAAIAVGREVGMSDTDIQFGLETYQPEPGRCQHLAIGDWSVIDDSYNASPASMLAGIQLADDWTGAHHRILVLGDMLELGDQAEAYHYSVGARLAVSSVDHTLLLGSHAKDVAEGFISTGGTMNRISVFDDWSTLKSMLDCLISPGDLILIKGSRSMQMEQAHEFLSTLCEVDSEPFKRAA